MDVAHHGARTVSQATDRRDTIDATPVRGPLRDLIARMIRKRDLDLRVAAPASVVSYDPITQTAMCTLGYLRVASQEVPAASGELLAPLPPELVRARVAVVQGATHSDHIPIAPGDTGLLVFCDRALDQWYIAGGAAVDPGAGRTHDQADAVFLPGLAPDAKRSTPPVIPTARTIDAPTIALGSAAAPVTGAALRGGEVAVAALAAATALTAAVSSTPTPLNPATVLLRCEANTLAIQALLTVLQTAISAKVIIE